MVGMTISSFNWMKGKDEHIISTLQSVFIDRNDPGRNDSVEIIVKWYGSNSKSKLVFKKSYLFKATMNFGIVANESIDDAYIAPPDDEDLTDFYKKWKGFFDQVKLHCYVIKTSSTGGEIKILAEDVEMIEI
ncbi:hypothetical protein [Chitinophaga filiformis]|uniref:Uncharacterized protein n=1 Tax=Chitinophaga filiformis TaxID=104663 RepID=A0A1G7SZ29_CHIFI|nr:hypothetical protein [Chitinophaga filiformis]SDG28305.1 hypothetical protein SAMN04488121_1031077 [Chitinophaga filiformis]